MARNFILIGKKTGARRIREFTRKFQEAYEIANAF
jgi:hypothetical protein